MKHCDILALLQNNPCHRGVGGVIDKKDEPQFDSCGHLKLALQTHCTAVFIFVYDGKSSK